MNCFVLLSDLGVRALAEHAANIIFVRNMLQEAYFCGPYLATEDQRLGSSATLGFSSSTKSFSFSFPTRFLTYKDLKLDSLKLLVNENETYLKLDLSTVEAVDDDRLILHGNVMVDNLVDVTSAALRQLQSVNARAGFQLEVAYALLVLDPTRIFKLRYVPKLDMTIVSTS